MMSQIESGVTLTLILAMIYTVPTMSSENYNQDDQVPYLPLNEQKLQQMLEMSQWRKPPQDPINVKAELDKLNSSYIMQSHWPTASKKLGVVSAVALDMVNNVVVFHRADRLWTQDTFNNINNVYRGSKIPIPENTIVAFHKNSGAVVYELGKNMFYLPHGLTIDQESNIWVTDVALHQVMKLRSLGTNLTTSLVLGIPFMPGSGKNKFCKPTAVAVLPDGDFFVADGYCNSRIIKYSKSGEQLLSWGQNAFQGHAFDVAPANFFAIPHSLTLALDLGLMCVADRENGRVQCFNIKDGAFHSQYHSPIIGDRLFSAAYAPINGGQLYVVNGPNIPSSRPEHYTEVLGFVIDMQTSKLISKFAPSGGQFQNPHDIVVSADGTEIYVAELYPSNAYKFLSTDFQAYNQSVSGGVTKPTSTLDSALNPLTSMNASTKFKASDASSDGNFEQGSTIILVASLAAVFTILSATLVLLITRRRKRGNRRHAWDFPAVKPDSFKLGNLLDRKRGFEKLNQDASDEEPNASTNMLT